jgi:hypothetical protein
VASAEELIDLVVGATIAVALDEQPAHVADGQSALREFARGFRRLLLAHPAVLDAYRRRPVQDPTGLAVTEAVVSMLIADGLDEDAAIRAYAAVYAFAIGFAALEVRPLDLDRSALEGHPSLLRLSSRLADLFDDTVFDHGLDALLAASAPPKGSRR